ncbi:hypothetical protein Q8F55_003484 [Vanrija albida]|uniref:BTB domain-containing protein n=1 Tax=Vanrija albida TaxID=181172 RepID=A0ABR3Q4X5_9TREE
MPRPLPTTRSPKGHRKRASLPGSFSPGAYTSLASLHEDSASERSTTSDGEGDLLIVTADGPRLEASYTQVFAASRKLADLAAHFPCGWDPERSAVAAPEIRLYNREYECARTVRAFLELVSTGTLHLPAGGRGSGLVELVALTRFLRKHECSAALRVLLLHVRLWLADGAVSPLVAFVVSAVADDEDMCSRAMLLADHRALDPRCLPLEAWYRVPHHYLFALTRAVAPVGGAFVGPSIGDKFKSHLRAAKKYYGYPVHGDEPLETLDSMEMWG